MCTIKGVQILKFINICIFFLNVWHTQLKSYNIKFGNHKTAQGVNPENTIKQNVLIVFTQEMKDIMPPDTFILQPLSILIQYLKPWFIIICFLKTLNGMKINNC